MRLPRELVDRFELADAYDEEQWDHLKSPFNRAEIGWLALGLALRDHGDSTYLEPGFDTPGPMPPAWPSTLSYIQTHCGGWHGVTSISAQKGTGKTTLATSCAIEAAASGEWQVVYFLAEDDANGLRQRLFDYGEAWPECRAALGWLHFYSVPMGVTRESLMMDITAAVDCSVDRPILVIFDSINTIASLTRGNYLGELHDLGLWAMIARRISRGMCSFMLVSETNQRGQIKGANLGFWSDMLLTMKKSKNDAEIVELTLSKARRWKGEGGMGKYIRHYKEGRFYDADEIKPRLQLVGGGQPVDGEDIF